MENVPSAEVIPLDRVGVVPSVVYLRTVPCGIVTCTVKGWTNRVPSVSTTGAARRCCENELPELDLPGVGVEHIIHSLPKSVVRAHEHLGIPAGYVCESRRVPL